MRLTNKTQWDTRDLHRLVAAALASWNSRDKPLNNKRLRVVVAYTTAGGASGCAYLNSHWLTVRVERPTGDQPMSDKMRIAAAYVLEHELAHCAGYTHRQMGNLNKWSYATAERFGYALAIEVRPKAAKPEPAPKPKADVQVQRFLRAEAQLARWQAKAKRAASGVAKAKTRVRYYERVLAADGRLAALRGGRP